MIRPKDLKLAQKLDRALSSFDKDVRPLRGIRNKAIRKVLIEQLLESIRRVKYVGVMLGRDVSLRRTNPDDDLFDPLLASIAKMRAGDIEEAFWLVFLFVHFGKHRRGGYRYAREIYGRLGSGRRWDWASTSLNPAGFREWLHANQAELRRTDAAGGFSGHRRYESLDGNSDAGTGAVVESYISWIAPPRTHQELISDALTRADGDSRLAFNILYKTITVHRFGRLARFDYLAMLGKLGLADIRPDSAYVAGATGPATGARLLFGGKSLRPAALDELLIELDKKLDVGMQVIEDALCNWQKSPRRFKSFRG